MAKKRVLIVEDNLFSRTVTRDILEAAGYEAAEAADGTEGLAKAESLRPDVILLDLVMSGLHGYDVCQRLKANPSTSHIPVIFVSAMKHEAVKAVAIDTGAAAYITKPLHPEALAATIEAALAKTDRPLEDMGKGGGTEPRED